MRRGRSDLCGNRWAVRLAGLTAMVLMIDERSIDGRLTPPSPGRYAIDRLKRTTGGRSPSCTWTERIETVARVSSTELSRERHGPRQAHFGAAVGKDSKPKGGSDVAYSIGRYIRVSPTLIRWRSGIEKSTRRTSTNRYRFMQQSSCFWAFHHSSYQMGMLNSHHVTWPRRQARPGADTEVANSVSGL